MRQSIRWLILLTGLLISRCESPFKTEPNIEGPTFEVTATLSTQHLIDFATIGLTWPQVGFDDFKEYQITRKNIAPLDTLNNDLVVRARISDPIVHAWQDTIFDDESVRYQVIILGTKGPIGMSEVDVEVLPVTHFIVPTDKERLEDAVRSPLIDNGDSVLVLPGSYPGVTVDFGNKAINLIGVEGASATMLGTPESNESSVMIRISAGLVKGFTISGGQNMFGGGIYGAGSAVVRQCVISGNETILGWPPNGGFGGGLYLQDSSRVENCLIISNSALFQGGGIYVYDNANDVRIVNCTIYANQSAGLGGGIATSGGTVIIENTLVINNEDRNIFPGPTSFRTPLVTYSSAGEEWLLADSTNVSGDPLFVDPANGNFHLQPGSIALDAGNPDPAYNDPGGTLNDLGAYGGPGGDW